MTRLHDASYSFGKTPFRAIQLRKAGVFKATAHGRTKLLTATLHNHVTLLTKDYGFTKPFAHIPVYNDLNLHHIFIPKHENPTRHRPTETLPAGIAIS
jgi:hypothetical protein